MTLANELSLEELLHYRSNSLRPADFDQFWDDGLAEVNAIDPDVHLAPSSFKIPFGECFDLFFTGTKQARIYAKLIRPRPAIARGPGLLIFHGYSGNSGGWSDKPSKLGYVAAGFTVAAMDCRAQGGRSLDRGERAGWSLRGHIVRGLSDSPQNLYYRDVFLDTVQLARVMMSFDHVDSRRIGVMGESQGGGLSLACASLVPSIRKVAPTFPFLCDYSRAAQFDTIDNAYAEIREYLRRFHPQGHGSSDVFSKLSYIDVQHLTSRIQGDTLMAIGLADTRCPPSTQFAAYNNIATRKTVEIYSDYGHERLPDHEDRVFEFMMSL